MIKPIDNPAAGEEPDFEEDFSDVFDPESFEPEVPAPGSEPESEDEAAVEFRIEDFEVEEYLPESEETRPDLRPECDEFFAPGGPLRRAAEFGGRPYESVCFPAQDSGAYGGADIRPSGLSRREGFQPS